jgi:hypothetical protein
MQFSAMRVVIRTESKTSAVDSAATRHYVGTDDRDETESVDMKSPGEPSKAALRAECEAALSSGAPIRKVPPTSPKLKPRGAEDKGEEEKPTRPRRWKKPVLVEECYPLIKAAPTEKVLGKVSRESKPLICIQKNLKHQGPPPYSRRTLYSDLLPLSLVADRLRPEALARLAEIVRLRSDDAAVTLVSGWLRARVRGDRGTYDLIFCPSEAPKPQYHTLVDIDNGDFGDIVAALYIFHEELKPLRHYFPLSNEGRICDAAFGRTVLWRLNNDERRYYNLFVFLRQRCDPRGLQEPRREYLPRIEVEEEEKKRVEEWEAAVREFREPRAVRVPPQNRGVGSGQGLKLSEFIPDAFEGVDGKYRNTGYRVFRDVHQSDTEAFSGRKVRVVEHDRDTGPTTDGETNGRCRYERTEDIDTDDQEDNDE